VFSVHALLGVLAAHHHVSIDHRWHQCCHCEEGSTITITTGTSTVLLASTTSTTSTGTGGMAVGGVQQDFEKV
jgi:hypothetical protein